MFQHLPNWRIVTLIFNAVTREVDQQNLYGLGSDAH